MLKEIDMTQDCEPYKWLENDEPDDYYRALFQQAGLAQLVLNRDGHMICLNRKAQKLLDVQEEKNELSEYIMPDERDTLTAWIQRVFREKGPQVIEIRIERGEAPASIRLNGEKLDDYPHIAQVSLIDLSIEQKNGKNLLKMAYYDHLTGLPNRYLLKDRMRWAIRDALRHEEHMAVLAIDLDTFKQVNDTFGHKSGDELLQVIGRRMAKCLRDSDTLARLGGDEFIVLMQHLEDSQDTVVVAERLLESIRQPVTLMNLKQIITGSIGICLFPQDSTEAHELMEKADIALYRAKRNGKDQYAFFNETMKQAADQQIDFERRLRKALDQEELTLYYQPIISAASRKIIALEALLRWNSPIDGLVPARSFLPVAEGIGIAHQITDWALRRAFKQMRNWIDNGILSPESTIRLTVNLSEAQLREPGFAGQLEALMQEYALSTKQLVLEICESILYQNDPVIEENMKKINHMTFQLYLDDLRQGFNTFNRIHTHPFSMVKINPEMTQAFMETPHGALLLSTLIRLSHLLDLNVIAEGIETEAALERLVQSGCDALQGYGISQPLHPVQAEMLLSLQTSII